MPQRWPQESGSGVVGTPSAGRVPGFGGGAADPHGRPLAPELREDTRPPPSEPGRDHLIRAGERAVGVAHDLRNALTLARLSLEREAGQAGVEMAQTRRALEEARALCVRFLAEPASDGLASASSLRLRDLFVHELQAVSELQPGGASIVLRCPRRLRVQIDGVVLARAVRNLALNAVRASASSAVVRVRARAFGTSLCVVVHDQGRGMDAIELSAAMQPARTTRGAGGGFGSVSLLDCVRELGGRLVVRSARGVGTRCLLWLPGDTVAVPGGRWLVAPEATRAAPSTAKRSFSTVGDVERALRTARPAEIRARRSLPARELARLEQLCERAGVPLTLEGLRTPKGSAGP